MASAIYNSFKKKTMQGLIALDTDTIKIALCTASYTPDIDANVFFSDLTNEVAAGGGYTAGGNAMTSKVVTQDNTNDLAYFDADDASWPSATFTARYAIIYKSTGTPSTSPLIAVIDLGGNKSPSGDTLTIQWATAGVLKIS